MATFIGTADDNTLEGTGGNDTIDGGGGADVVKGGAGADSLVGGSGDDVIDGGSSADTLVGGLGADSMVGGSGADTLFGGDGADTLSGGSGDDVLIGGNGSDYYIVDSINDVVVEGIESGIDEIEARVSYTLSGTALVERLSARSDTNANINLNAAAARHSMALTGNNGRNVLTAGNVTPDRGQVDGFGSNLRGEGGADTLRGGNGRDTFDPGLDAADDYMEDLTSSSDSYHFGRNGGRDVINDRGGGTDQVLIDPGIPASSLVFARERGSAGRLSNDLILSIDPDSDSVREINPAHYLRIRDHFTTAGRIEFFVLLQNGQEVPVTNIVTIDPIAATARARVAAAAAGSSPLLSQVATMVQEMARFAAAGGAAASGVSGSGLPGPVDLTAAGGPVIT